jgi:hypothetical protein
VWVCCAQLGNNDHIDLDDARSFAVWLQGSVPRRGFTTAAQGWGLLFAWTSLLPGGAVTSVYEGKAVLTLDLRGRAGKHVTVQVTLADGQKTELTVGCMV